MQVVEEYNGRRLSPTMVPFFR